ncbi:MAG: undecaprenyl-phosphate galactose phosphotransferase WbaP [Rhodothermales bacterium]|nr:undecaprenyl-phosphate galactose phosphotransferase WbaP [Rhodothermales bacterium]
MPDALRTPPARSLRRAPARPGAPPEAVRTNDAAAASLHHLRTTEAAGRRRAVLYHRRRAVNAAALGLGDGLAFAAAMLLAGGLRAWWMGDPMIPAWSVLLLPAWWLGAWSARLLPGWGLGAVEELRRMVLLLGLAFVGTAFALFLSKQSEATSRLTLTMAFALSLVLVPYARTLVKKLLYVAGQWGIPTVLYGNGATTRRVVETLRQEGGLGYHPVAIVDDRPGRSHPRAAGLPVYRPTDPALPDAAVAILSVPDVGRHRTAGLLEGPLARYKQVLLIPDLAEVPSLWVRSRDLAGVLGLEVTSNLLDPLARFGKRAADLALVALTLPLWLPLCLAAALAIRLEDGGAALYYQERIGRGGVPFRAIKLRTMVPDAERVLHDALRHDPALQAEWDATFKLRRDPRVTRTGRWLRRASLDELPQLWNVLRGEMSLVGPRPLPAYHHRELSERTQALRQRLRPGLTGLWQVSGRSDIGNEGMERWDPYYIRNWSIWLDLVILFRTVRALLCRSGAY